jgi:3-oxoacyl-[acyl-carrier-protein] synthase III
MSDIVAPDDESTAILFGDGAGAVVVTGDGGPRDRAGRTGDANRSTRSPFSQTARAADRA